MPKSEGLNHHYLRTEAALRPTVTSSRPFTVSSQRDSSEAAIRFLCCRRSVISDVLAGIAGARRATEHSDSRNLPVLRAWQVRGFENYVIFYRPIEHGVEIVRVLHAARDIAAIFEDET